MRSTFAGLNTMVRGIYAHQIALDTVGNNITNLNTDGYTRQRTNLVETPSGYIVGNNGYMAIGTGSVTDSIVRLRDELIDAQVRKNTSPLGYDNIQQETLGKIENIFKEPSDTGLQTALDNFWDSMQQLATQAGNEGYRSVVRQRGVELADAIGRAESQLKQIQTDANLALTTKLKNMNQYLTELAAVNKQILASPTDQCNALKDQQDLLLEKIAVLAPIQVVKEESGSVTVSIAGITVVSKDRANLLDTSMETNGGIKMAGTGMDVMLGAEGGELQGLLDSRDSKVWGAPAYLEQIGTMSRFLLSDFNAVHRSGYGLDNNTGVNFFGSSVFGTGTDQVGSTLQLASSTTIPASTRVPADTTLTLNDGTKTINVALVGGVNTGWTLDKVAEAINAQAKADGANIRAAYDTATQQFQIYSIGSSNSVTATEPSTSSFIKNTLKLETPDADYWLSQLEVNPALFEKGALSKIAAKMEIGSVGTSATEVKTSNIWQGNTSGGLMSATVTGDYTFDPASLPIRLRIAGLTTNPDGTKVPSSVEYSTDGKTWTAATAGSTSNSFKFTVQGATVEMSIAANAANAANDIYVVTLPASNAGKAGSDNIVKLSNLLKVTTSTLLGNTSLDGYYNNLIGTLGVQSQNSQNQATNQKSLVDQTLKMRDAVSGVNLDEELTSMIKFQKGYNGCARVLTAMDELLETLINKTGVVGR